MLHAVTERQQKERKELTRILKRLWEGIIRG
jgi:hypothetical protein